MTDYLPYLAILAIGIAFGGVAVNWLKSRKTTTKAEALRLLAAEYALVMKMPGAAEAASEAEAQAASEAIAAKQLAAAVMKASGVPAQS